MSYIPDSDRTKELRRQLEESVEQDKATSKLNDIIEGLSFKERDLLAIIIDQEQRNRCEADPEDL